MIKKLQIKLVLLSMSALLLMLTLIITGINVVNYRGIVREADSLLAILAENNGAFPQKPEETKTEEEMPEEGKPDGQNPGMSFFMSPEVPYESRYFSAALNIKSEEVVRTETAWIASVDTQEAVAYAREAWSGKKEQGFLDHFRYIVDEDGETVNIIFLDCGRKLDSFRSFLFASVGISLIGYAAVFLLVVIFSNRMIRPVSESYEKQKRFITDAGHEIKTPLTIINADIDVLELDMEENEWLDDIRRQAKRLTSLTNDLVYLARMEEASDSMQMIEFPVSDIVGEAAASFQAVAQTQGKTFRCDVAPMLSFNGNEKAIRQLVNILLDNALKYSQEGGTVCLSLEKQKKMLVLSVFNTTDYLISKETLPMLFERFYRMDSSRNSQMGGHGIGLSVARAIVNAHGGKIQAKTKDGYSLEIVAALPM